MLVATNQARSSGHHRLALCSAGSSAKFAAAGRPARGPARTRGGRRSAAPACRETEPAHRPNQQSAGVVVCRASTAASRAATDDRQVPLGGGVVPQPGLVVVAAELPGPGDRGPLHGRVGGAAVEGGDLRPGHVLSGSSESMPNSLVVGIAHGRVEDAGVGLEDGRDGDATRWSAKGRSVLGDPGELHRKNLPRERTTPGLFRGAVPADQGSCTRADWTMSAARGSGDCPVLARRRTTDGRSAVAQTESERAAHLDGG